MGIFDDVTTPLGRFLFSIGGLGDIVSDAGRLVQDSTKEFSELMTDGFVEMVIKESDNYKTSYELNEEAEKRISSSKRKFIAISDSMNDSLKELEKNINNLYDKKIRLAKQLNEKNYFANSSFDIKLKQTIEKIDCEPFFSENNRSISKVDTIFHRNGFIPEHPTGGFFESTKDRKSKANDFNEDSKDFAVMIDSKIAQMNRAQAHINAIQQSINEEDKLIDRLTQSLRMNRDLEYQKIAGSLEKLIMTYILGENGEIDNRYSNSISAIRSFCEKNL